MYFLKIFSVVVNCHREKDMSHVIRLPDVEVSKVCTTHLFSVLSKHLKYQCFVGAFTFFHDLFSCSVRLSLTKKGDSTSSVMLEVEMEHC